MATLWKSALAASNRRWYGGLLKPTFTPAPGLALVATCLVAAALTWGFYRVLQRPDYLPDRPAAIRLFGMGIALDAVWSWLFFAGRHPSAALVAAAALAVVSALTTWRFAVVEQRAGLLLLPWAMGTVFTFLFDLSIAMRNG